MIVRVRDIVYSITARTTSCFGGRFTLTGEILGRGSMRVSDPPPVTVEARRGSTDTHTHTETSLSRPLFLFRSSSREDVDTRSSWGAYAHARTGSYVW